MVNGASPMQDRRMVRVGVASWREMTELDLASVERIGDVVHPDYPEDATVISERQRLYPAGCLVLDDEQGIQGYTVAHPWLFGRPPPLNTQLGGLPVRADTFYIHDLAILPGVRGRGFGRQAVDLLKRQAELDASKSLSLVAVGKSVGFWRTNGFELSEQDAIGTAVATYEGAVFMARVLP